MSSSAQSGDAPNPQLVWDTLNAYQRTAALKAAIDLDPLHCYPSWQQYSSRAGANVQRLRAWNPYPLRLSDSHRVALEVGRWLISQRNQCDFPGSSLARSDEFGESVCEFAQADGRLR